MFEKKICCKILERAIIYVFTNFHTVLSICDFTVVMSFNVIIIVVVVFRVLNYFSNNLKNHLIMGTRKMLSHIIKIH